MFRAATDDDLVRFIFEFVVRRELVRDRLSQLGNAGARRVFRKAAFERCHRRSLDVFRRVEVRLARAEAADIEALGFHCLGFAVD